MGILKRFLLAYLLCLSFISCEDTSDLIPIEGLPFEYNVDLELHSLGCYAPNIAQQSQAYSGSLTLGTQNQLTVAEINTSDFRWNLQGTRCLNETGRVSALCLALRQSVTVTRLERAAGLRRPQDKQMSCLQWTSIPDTAPPTDGDKTLLPSDSEWQQSLEDCCLSDEGHPHTVKVIITEDNTLSALLSVRYSLDIQLPSNSQPNSLSSEEYEGLIAQCGGPINCVNRFLFKAEPQQ